MFKKGDGKNDGKATIKHVKKHSTLKRDTLSQMTQRTLGTGNMKSAVMLPEGEDEFEWIAANTVDFFNEVSLLYGLVSDQAQEKFSKVGEGFPSGVEYRWSDGSSKTPTRVSAPEYVDYVLSWIEAQVDDPSIFPVNESDPFPPDFKDAYVKDIFKRMFRIFAIIYHRHFEKIQEIDAAAHLNTCFKHFIFFSLYYKLLEEAEMNVMKLHIERLKEESKYKRDLPVFCSTVWEHCNQRVIEIKQNKAVSVLNEIDGVSERVCEALDIASCLASVADEEETRGLAGDTYLGLYAKVQELNCDPQLYQCLLAEKKSCQLSEEAQRVRQRVLSEFEWEGANLPNKEARSRVIQNQNRLREAEMRLQNLNNQFVSPFEKNSRKPKLIKERDLVKQYVRETRHSVAKQLGFHSYAHLTVQKNMIKNPAVIGNFLVTLAEEIKPIMRTYFTEEELSLPPVKLNAKYGLQTASPSPIDHLFTVQSSMKQIRILIQNMFGLDLQVTPITAPWAPAAKCFEARLIDLPTKQVEGLLYLDLFAREGKMVGPALFQLRSKIRRNSGHQDDHSVALLTASIVAGRGRWEDTVIGHFGFRVLMHEIGHALHALLSRSEYQHLSGTRCEMELKETPSQLFEYLAEDTRVLKLFDDGLSDQVLREYKEHRTRGKLLQIHDKILDSLFDLRFNEADVSINEIELYWSIRNEFSALCLPKGDYSHWKNMDFPHFATSYAGSFYCYLYSDVNVANIYEKLLKHDLFGNGPMLRTELFNVGGSRDPQLILDNLLDL